MSERAFILPGVILLLTLLATTITPLHDCFIMALRTSSEESLSGRAENLVENTAMLDAFDFVAPEATRTLHSCKLQSAKISRVNIEKTFCASYHSANSNLLKQSKLDSVSAAGNSNLPSLDFERFLTNALDCNSIGAQNLAPFFPNLSLGSSVSSYYCRLSVSKLSASHSLNANLQIVSNLNVASATLSARGFLQATSILTISSDAKIIAGGDIYIESLSANTPSELTLISASGDVKVNSISGPLTLKVFAAQKALIPSNAIYSDSGFEDYKLDFLPIGFLE